MRLFIAEKHDAARRIADALRPRDEQQHLSYYINCGDDVVTWANGHLYEQAPPEYYDPKYKKWRIEDLPIIPKIVVLPIKDRQAQIDAIHALLQVADVVVHACDPDREGQLIGDEILAKGPQTTPVRGAYRLWLDDLDKVGVLQAIAAMKPNLVYRPLMKAAKGRSDVDWLRGINCTRLCTIAGRNAGFLQKFNIGRVKTPTLALIVTRDREIEHFVSIPFWAITAMFRHSNGMIATTWHPDRNELGVDTHGRAIDKCLVERVRNAIDRQYGRILTATEQLCQTTAPLPLDLTELQVQAHKAAKLSAKETATAAQSLYERHGLISYPRTDCRYLNDRKFDEARDILAAIMANDPAQRERCAKADPSIKGRAFNDQRAGQVAAHTAIVPNTARMDVTTLNTNERIVYDLVCRGFIAQFYPPYEYVERSVTIECQQELFEAKHRTEQDAGWMELYPMALPAQTLLPRVAQGDAVRNELVTVLEKATEPPKRFNSASLMRAMKNISYFMQADDETLERMATCGLGTVATRADIIENLISDKFVHRKGTSLISTQAGRNVVDSLQPYPEYVQPNYTAEIEFALAKVQSGELSFETFTKEQEVALRELLRRTQISRKSSTQRMNESAAVAK